MFSTITCRCGQLLVVPAQHGSDEPVRCDACGAVNPPPSITAGPGAAEARFSPDHRPSDLPFGSKYGAGDILIRRDGLCSHHAVWISTLLCGPLAGFLLLAHNDGVLRRRAGSWLMLGLGFALSIAELLVVGLLFGDDRGYLAARLLVPIANALALGLLTVFVYRHPLAQQRRLGAPGARAILLISRSILGMLLFLGLAFGLGYLGELATADSQVAVGKNKNVFFAGGVPEADAQKLGKALLDEGLFDGDAEQVARLSREGDTVVVTFWIDRALDPESRDYYKDLARRLSVGVFNRTAVRIRLMKSRTNTALETLDSGPAP